MVAMKTIPVFEPIGIQETLVYRALNLSRVQFIVTTKSYIVVVRYLMSAQKPVAMQDKFKSVVFIDSEQCKKWTDTS